MNMSTSKKLFAEFLGTFWLVLGGCGSAVLAATFPAVGIGLLGVSLAFGLTVLTMVYAVGHISGGHFNPAVSVGLWVGGRFPSKDLPGYIIAQVAWCHCGCRCFIPDCQRKQRIQPGGRFCSQWLWRTFPGQIFTGSCIYLRSCYDFLFSDHYPGCNA